MSSIPPQLPEGFLNFITQEHSEGELRGFSFEKDRSSKLFRIQTKFSKTASMENCRRIEETVIFALDQNKENLNLKQIVALEKNLHILQRLTQNEDAISQVNELIYERNLGGLKNIQEKGLHCYVAITEEATAEAEKYQETLNFEDFGTVSVPPIPLIFEVIDILIERNPEIARDKIENFIENTASETASTVIACVIPFVTERGVVSSLARNQEDPERIQSVAVSILTTLLSRRGIQESPEWAAFRAGLRDRTF